MIPALFRIAPDDSTATALRDMAAGEEALGVTLAGPVAKGHKVAVKPIAAGEPVLKFGFPIGLATRAIAPGEHVHTHNVATALGGGGDYAFTPAARAPARIEGPAFLGYRRADGRVGTRNEIWVIPTVGCVARTAQKIAERAAALHPGKIDGIHAFPIRSAARSWATTCRAPAPSSRRWPATPMPAAC